MRQTSARRLNVYTSIIPSATCFARRHLNLYISIIPSATRFARRSSVDSVAEEKKTQSLVSPVRPSLPSLDKPEASQQQPVYDSGSIFQKKGSGSNAVYTCSKGEYELPGLACWSSTHLDGTHSIKMQALIERWNNNNKSLSGPPNPHMENQKAERSKQRFSVTFKSVLLAQESEEVRMDKSNNNV